MAIFARTNDALEVNPAIGADFRLSTAGSDWLWAVTAIYSFSLLLVVGHTYFARAGEKIFHYAFTITLFVGAVTYFAMASDLGYAEIETADNTAGIRQVFYARYINWFVGWSPLILAIGLFSGVSWSTIIYNIVLSWIWVASWLAGALVDTSYKWGFFTFGTFSELLLLVSLFQTGLSTSTRVGIRNQYLISAGWLSFLWVLYPIAWGLDEGNEISVTSGFIWFGIMDVLTVPLLSFVILFFSLKWDYRALNLYFTQYGRVASGGEFPEREKPAAPAAAPAAAADPVVAPENAV